MIPLLLPLWFILSGYLFRALFRRVGIPWVHTGEELFFSASAGLGAISLSAMVIGLAGVAGTTAFAIAAMATGAAGALLRFRERPGSSPPGIRSPWAYSICLAPALLIPLVFLPPFFYDTLHYHYALPSIFLRSGHTTPLPHVVESFFPLGVEMLYMVGMADGGYIGASLGNILLLALCGLGILCLADRLGERRAGVAALCLFLFSSTAMYTVFMQKIDLGVTLFFFAFTYSLVPYLTGDFDRRFLILSGAFAGLALGTKYTMLAFVPAAALPAFAARFRTRDVLVFLAACVAVYAVWPVRNIASVGNPVYPVLETVFRSPGWSLAQSELLSGDAHPLRDMLRSWRDVALLAGSITFLPRPSVTGFGSSLGVSVIGAFAFLFRGRPAPAWAFLRNAVAACIAVWFLTFWFSRFLLPVLPMMALLTGKVFDDLGRKAGRAPGGVVAGLVALSLVVQLFTLKEPSNIVSAWKTSLSLPGRPARAAELVSRFVPSVRAAQFVNARLPERARLLFAGETMTYYYRRDFVAPSAFDVHPLQAIVLPGRSREEIRGELLRRGFTHVLVHWSEWDRLGKTYYRNRWPEEGRMAVGNFLEGLAPVYGDGVVSVYELGRKAGEP